MLMASFIKQRFQDSSGALKVQAKAYGEHVQ